MIPPLPPADLEEAAALACRAVEAPSDMLASAARAGGLEIRRKEDGSHLTRSDVEAERMVRSVLGGGECLSGASILGEEEGEGESSSRWRWIVDPIDGTHAFARDIPVYGTMVALQDRESGAVLVGAVRLPALDETFWAARGKGAFRNGAQIRVSQRRGLADAMVATGTPFQYRNSGAEHLHERLFGAVADLRSFGDVFAHMAAARGAVDAVFDPDLSLWDFAASRVIVEEAGGRVLVRETGRGRGHDVLLGAPCVVGELAALLEFRTGKAARGAVPTV